MRGLDTEIMVCPHCGKVIRVADMLGRTYNYAKKDEKKQSGVKE
jgi:hypothetical protein